MRRSATCALFVALTTATAGVAFAQAIPPGQSCGGLLCDMGVFGHKVPLGQDGSAPTPEAIAASDAVDPHTLPCHDFLCRAFGQKDASAVPPPPPPVAAAPVEPEPVAHKARRLRHTKVATRTPAPADTAPPVDSR